MSLNTGHANGGVLLYNGEVILLYCDGVEFHIDGADAKEFSGTKKGRIYLTSHRMIFTNKSSSDKLQSFCFPFFSMSKIELEQPIFGANYIKGIVTAQIGGNWNGRADFKLKFNSGGAIEFGQAMLQAAKLTSTYMPPQPPSYVPHTGPYYPAPPPAYTPPPGPYYGFTAPTHVFPDAPPANTVFMSNVPPPYPGIRPPPYSVPTSLPMGYGMSPVGGYQAPPQAGYGAPPPQGGPGAPSPQGGYGAPPPQGGYGAPPPQGGYGAPPPQGGYGAPPPQSGYGAPPPQSGYGAPPPNNGYGGVPPQPGFNPNGVPNGNPPHVMNGANAKAQEALQAYYDPHDPFMMYYQSPNNQGQAPQYDGPPPPYAESNKKNQ